VPYSNTAEQVRAFPWRNASATEVATFIRAATNLRPGLRRHARQEVARLLEASGLTDEQTALVVFLLKVPGGER
jgi:hypothetical protein